MFDDWTGPEIATFWIAIGAGAIGLVSLIWQYYYAVRIDRARLKVTISESKIFPDNIAVIAMTAVNVGRRATVLQSIHLTLGKRHRIRDRLLPILPRALRPSYDLMPLAVNELPHYNPDLPKRLEVGDEVTHYVPRELAADALRKNPQHNQRVHARGYASTARMKASKATKLDT